MILREPVKKKCGKFHMGGGKSPRDETLPRPLLTSLGSTGLVKKANVVGEDDLVSEYLMSRLSREYVIFHDKTH